MPKVITVSRARMISVTPTEKKPSRPDWREEYVSQVGLLRLFESERKHPGNNYAIFLSDDGSWLKTSCGEYRIAGDTLTLTTRNSRYEFQLIRQTQNNDLMCRDSGC